MSTIDCFEGKFEFLSNFFPSPVVFEGLTFPTSEHAFQAAKTLSKKERKEIAELPTPGRAKRAGKKVTFRSDWEVVKLQVMENILRIKFSNPVLRDKLLGTGSAQLIEGNTWGDRFWGVCDGQGNNYLGKILMKIREELRT